MRVLQRDMQKKILKLKKESDGRDDQLRERIEGSYGSYQRQNSLPVKLKKGMNLAFKK